MAMLAIWVLWAFAVLWHTLVFAAGSLNVWFAYRAMFGGRREASWARVIHTAEWQLRASGLTTIGLGSALAGWQSYFTEPRLWAKAMLITAQKILTIVIVTREKKYEK